VRTADGLEISGVGRFLVHDRRRTADHPASSLNILLLETKKKSVSVTENLEQQEI
jgi:hypothetical protein